MRLLPSQARQRARTTPGRARVFRPSQLPSGRFERRHLTSWRASWPTRTLAPRQGVTPMGICPPACHDTVVGGLRRAIAAVHAGDLSPTATRGRLGLVPLAAVGIAFGFASFLEARSAPGWSFAGTSALAAVAELA